MRKTSSNHSWFGIEIFFLVELLRNRKSFMWINTIDKIAWHSSKWLLFDSAQIWYGLSEENFVCKEILDLVFLIFKLLTVHIKRI